MSVYFCDCFSLNKYTGSVAWITDSLSTVFSVNKLNKDFYLSGSKSRPFVKHT